MTKKKLLIFGAGEAGKEVLNSIIKDINKLKEDALTLYKNSESKRQADNVVKNIQALNKDWKEINLAKANAEANRPLYSNHNNNNNHHNYHNH